MKRLIMQLLCASATSIILFFPAVNAQEFHFTVEHDHMIGSCKGELIITKDDLEFRTTNKDHARRWSYTDIKMIKLVSPQEIKVFTYESRSVKLGRDETFEFKSTKGEVSQEVSDFLLARVPRPLSTSFVKSDEKPTYAIPVRHRHTFSGEQGTLRIYDDGLTYESARTKSSRHWRWTDIKSLSRSGPFQFSITTYEPKFGGPTKTFNFDLKEQMNDTIYDYMWTRIFRSEIPASQQGKQ